MGIDKPKILCLFSAPLVAPNGDPLDALDFETERDAIVRELAALNKQATLRIGFATIDELARGISDGFNILHLSGHGHPDYLLFEDRKAGSQPVKGEYLKKLIATGGPFELAVVSACHSERIAQMILDAQVRHVVGIRCEHPVLDLAAIRFAGQFYGQLLRKAPIQKAFDMAKLLVEGDPELMKLKPELEITAQEEGEPFVEEENKFVLLPDTEPSPHSDPLLSEESPPGTLTIEEAMRPKTNIPARPQSFTGRSADMYALVNEVLANRLVTVTGAGGIGKTVVATEVARWFHSRGHFPHGIFTVNLREAETTGGIIGMLGAALDAEITEVEHVVQHLKGCQCLLLLDNAEDALHRDEDSVRDLLNEILKFAPGVRFLATSQREVGGNLHEPERVYRIRSLQRHLSALLFLLAAKRPMTQEEWKAEAFFELLKQMGGHPLSIVLMARQLLPGTALEDLVKRVRTQKAKAITVKGITDRDPEHGEDLVAALSSAYEHLSAEARIVFAILTMLPAGAQDFTMKTVYGDKGWEYVQELHDACLAEIPLPGRADLLAPVRLFAVTLLTDEIRNEYGPRIVEAMAGYVDEFYWAHGGEDAKHYRAVFAMEEPNLRYATTLPSAPAHSAHESSGLGYLSSRLLDLYVLNNRYSEGLSVGEPALSKLVEMGDKPGQASTLATLGDLALRCDDPDQAGKSYDRALKIFRNVDAKVGQANTLRALGDLAMRRDDLDQAEKSYDEALEIYRKVDEKIGQANTLRSLGDLAVRRDRATEAEKSYDEALEIYRKVGQKMGQANTLHALGDLAMRRDDLDQAGKRYDEALQIFRKLDAKLGQANTLQGLGDLAMRRDHLDQAGKSYDEALEIFRKVDDKVGQANTLMTLGDLAMRRHDLDQAGKSYDEALEIYRKVDEKLGQATTLGRVGQLFALRGKAQQAETSFAEAMTYFIQTQDLDGQADINMGRALLSFTQGWNEKGRSELNECASLREKVLAHGEAARWLILYADHLKSRDLRDGAEVCLEYAQEFATKAHDARLQEQVKQRLRDLRGSD